MYYSIGGYDCPIDYNRNINYDRDQTSFNCAGFTFRDYTFMPKSQVKGILSKLQKIDCGKTCRACDVKIWFWENIVGENFHLMGSQTSASGKDPKMFYSKDGTGAIIRGTIPQITAGFRPSVLSCYCMPIERFQRSQ